MSFPSQARLTSSPPRPPETRSVWKDGRAEGVHEGKARVKEGEQWREHTVRKFMRNVRPQIFPDLNDSHVQVKEVRDAVAWGG